MTLNSQPTPGQAKRRRVWILIATVLLVVTIGALVWESRRTPEGPGPGPPTPGDPPNQAEHDSLWETVATSVPDRIKDLRAIHQFDHNANPRLHPPEGVIAGQEGTGSIWDKKSDATKARTPNVPHPIARTHPDTGRKALFVNRRFTIAIEDMDADEGENLLLELFDHCEQPQFVYRHKWRVGDLLMWDNRCLIHVACGGFNLPEIRQMYRTTLTGTPTL